MNGIERVPAGALLERTADIPVFIAVSAVQSGYFHNKVRSILVLPGALGADHLVRMKDIHSLAAEYRVFMGNQWQIVSAVPIPGRHGGSNRVRSGIAGVDAVVFKENRLIITACACRSSNGRTEANLYLCATLLGG